MTYEYGYAVSALAFLSVVAFHYFRKKRYPGLQNRIYGTVMIFALADLVLDIAGSWTIMHAQTLPPWINYGINSPFYAIQCLLPASVFLYVLAVAQELHTKSRPLIAAALLPSLACVLAILSNPFTRWIFYAEPGMPYLRGPYFNYLYLPAAFYLLLSFAALFFYRRKYIKVQFVSILLFLIFTVTGVLIQFLFPAYLLSSMVIALSITMMFFAMEIPEDMLDAITGAYNHAALMRYLDQGVRHRRELIGFAVTVEGLLNQGQNLTLAATNEAVRQMGDYLSRLCPNGLVFRMSAAVYVALTEDRRCYEKAIGELKEKSRFRVEAMGAGVELPLTVCAFSEGELVTSSTNFTRLVEVAFQDAKARGKSGLIQIDTETMESLNRYAAVESAMETALSRGAFDLHFQPIYSLEQQRFVSAEALLRLRDPVLGDIPAQEMIAIAEANGTITRIDRHVLRTVCRFIREQGPLEKYGLDMITVNVSTIDLLQEDLYESIVSVIREEGIPFDSIGLEITESAAAAFSDDLVCLLRSLSRQGIRFLLDDFGAGYSNLHRIARLPLYAVKMDQSMFSYYQPGTPNAVIFEEMVRMCKRLGYLVIVEGISQSDQIRTLGELGADRIQGYHYAKPLPAEEFLRLFE